ncbi:F-box/kelch-repeat protein At3g23880-like [Silene latifolia]|uniref:F-box/kelch-repeat protein At3g23880-like n=1 Tax=Silene latifolia TaxID=37657 RepID=UPI003D776DCB
MNMSTPSSNKYIPPEVLILILAILPVKSLLRFSCVCKFWRSIIYSPDFVLKHFKLFNNNKSNSGKLLALERLGFGPYGDCFLRLRDADTFRNIADIFMTSEKYDLVGTCGSLILISRSQNILYRDMRLCTPSIRKSLLLPPCPLLPSDGYTPTFVLGFATRIEDYKIIAIAFKQSQAIVVPEMCVVVYTLTDPQWTVRVNGLNIDFLSFKDLFGPFYFCEGAAHCLGKNPYTDSSYHFGETTHLVSLDFDSENFTFLELPPGLGEIGTTSRALFLLGESLAFFCISPDSFRIWLLKQESRIREWSLWFLGRSSSDGLDMFDYMGSKTQRVLYYVGDDGWYLVYDKKSYNIFTSQVRKLGRSIRHEVELATYFESLVLCNKDGTEDMA